MRIAFVAPFGLRAKGTTRARALPLAQAIARRGHEAALFVPPYDSPEDAGRSWQAEGVRVVNVSLPRGTARRGAAGALAQLRLGWRLWTTVRAWHPDVLHIFKPKGPSGLVGSLAWISARQAVVVDADDWEGPGGWNDDPRAGYSPLQRTFFAWQERYGLAHAHAWTVTSACLCQRAIAFGADSRHVCLLPNGLADPALWQGASLAASGQQDPPSILLYTRFAGVCLEEVMELWRRVRIACPGTLLTVVGRGLGGEEHKLAEAEPGVHAVGWVEPAAMPELFARHAAAVVPWANTPANQARHSAKVLELMAAGLPVVATAVGELPATLGEAGVLVPPGDPAAFAQAVTGLLGNPGLRQGLGAAARERVFARYTWDRLADTALTAFKSAQGLSV